VKVRQRWAGQGEALGPGTVKVPEVIRMIEDDG